MLAELKHTLRRKRGQIIGWAIGLALYGLLMASMFDSIVGIEGFADLMAAYPEDLAAFFLTGAACGLGLVRLLCLQS